MKSDRDGAVRERLEIPTLSVVGAFGASLFRHGMRGRKNGDATGARKVGGFKPSVQSSSVETVSFGDGACREEPAGGGPWARFQARDPARGEEPVVGSTAAISATDSGLQQKHPPGSRSIRADQVRCVALAVLGGDLMPGAVRSALWLRLPPCAF